MEQIKKRLIKLVERQKNIMASMSQEKCDDIHSVLRAKNFAEAIIEMEAKKQLLIEILSEQ
jgi:hypothetical protein